MASPSGQQEEASTVSRGDPAWNHCTLLDMTSRKVKCRYCGKEMSGGVFRLKQHLAHVKGDVKGCERVPMEVRAQFKSLLDKHRAEKARTAKKNVVIREELARPSGGPGIHIYGAGHEPEEDTRRRTHSFEGFDPSELRRGMEASRKSFAEDRYYRETGHYVGEGSGSGQGSGIGQEANQEVHDLTRDDDPRVGPIDPYLTRGRNRQPNITAALKNLKICKEKIGRATSRWFFYNSVAANTAKGPYYENMIDTIAEVGKGVSGPTPKEIYNTYLSQEVNDLREYIKSFERIWDERGCTIMTDGWTGITRRTMINFLVYCQAGTIFMKSVDASGHIKNADYLFKLMDELVEQVGEHRVVQVVTDNAASYKLAGHMLMEKRSHLYWVPCSAHSIDLMLEDMCKDEKIANTVASAQFITTYVYNHGYVLKLMREHTRGRELIRPGATRFASTYISLESLHSQRRPLLQMVSSKGWEEWLGVHAKQDVRTKGKKVEELIENRDLWKDIKMVLSVVEPIVKVLRIVDGDKKADMGYLYEAIERAKEEIQKSNPKTYLKWWDIIDERWDKTLHHDLHAAGYFFNPRYQYGPNVKNDDEVLHGVKNVIQRMLDDEDRAIIACNKMHDYRLKLTHFATHRAQRAVMLLSPADWWMDYGKAPGYEDLAYVAIRVLSQTTSASGCERNWSTFSLIHSKQRNKLTSSRLEQLVFCHYNMRLKIKNLQRIQEGQKEEARWRDEAMGQPTTQPTTTEETIDLDDIFEEENPLHSWVDARMAMGEAEFDPNDRAWAEGELDDIPLSAAFQLPAKKMHKGKSKKKSTASTSRNPVDIADLDTIEEGNETPSPEGTIVYQTSDDSTSASNHDDDDDDDDDDPSQGGTGAAIQSQHSRPASKGIVFTEEQQFSHATQDRDHSSRTTKNVSSGKGKQKVQSVHPPPTTLEQGIEDTGYNPNFIPYRRNWLRKKKAMKEEFLRRARETSENYDQPEYNISSPAQGL